MKLFLMLIIACFLFGCASGGYKKMTLPDGEPGYRVTCMNDKQPCYDKSREACGGNYSIITDSRIDKFRSELLIQCKK